jgi:hypothetical protein
MADFDTILISPTREELDTTLRQAFTIASGYIMGGGYHPPNYDPNYGHFLREFATERSGWWSWEFRDASSVGVVWWTDFIGRKLLRVSSPGHGHSHGQGDVEALALFCPDQTYFRTRDSERCLFVLCPCGATGKPEELGWMGRCCAPCHDRQEAGETVEGRNWIVQARNHSPIRHLAFSPDGRRLAWLGGEDRVQVLDLRSPEATARQTVPAQGSNWFAFSPGGEALVLIDGRGRVLEVKFSSGKGRMLTHLRYQPTDPRHYTSNAKMFAALSGWEAVLCSMHTSGQKRGLCLGSADGAHCVALAPNGRALALGTPDGAYWCQLTGKGDRDSLRLRGTPLGMAFAPDGKLLAVFTTTGEVVFWYGLRARSVTAAGQARLLGVPENPFSCVQFSPDGRTLVCSSPHDGRLFIWDVPGATLLPALGWHWAPVTSLAFSPDGRLLACGDTSGTVRLWPVEVLRPVKI